MDAQSLVLERRQATEFEPAQIEAAADVLRSGQVNYWTGGVGRELEREFSRFCGTEHAVVVASYGIAVQLALRGLRITRDQKVIVSDLCCETVLDALRAMQIEPVFAESDPTTGNMDVESAASLVDPDTRAVLVSHFAGWPCEMHGFVDLCRRNSLKLIEDCTDAFGSQIDGRSVGTFGGVAIWGFVEDGLVTTAGEGAILTTGDEALWRRMWSFKDHGKDWDAMYNRQYPPGFRYQHEHWGTNWRLTEFQSAIALAQLRSLPERLVGRRQRAIAWKDALRDCSRLEVAQPCPGAQHAWAKAVAWSEVEVTTELSAQLSQRGVNLETVGHRGFFLPTSASLEMSQIRKAATALADVIESA